MTGGGSLVVRRRLGARLRELRLAAGKDVDDVAEAGLASKAKLWRIENGRGPVKVADVLALCLLYGVDQVTRDALAALAPGTQQGGAYAEEYGTGVVPEWFGLYAGLEATASRIRTFDPDLVHGLMQTEEYARAVIAGGGQLTSDLIEQRVRFRLERQRRIFSADGPTQITFIMGEAALVSVVGSVEVMTEQIEHLRVMERRRNVAVRVVPFTAGTYPRRGNFALLDFNDEDDPSVAYLDLPIGARYFDTPQDRARYEHAYQIVADLSVPLKEWKV
jgi:transcriptional regulator with XRE-family HTH domain